MIKNFMFISYIRSIRTRSTLLKMKSCRPYFLGGMSVYMCLFKNKFIFKNPKVTYVIIGFLSLEQCKIGIYQTQYSFEIGTLTFKYSDTFLKRN